MEISTNQTNRLFTILLITVSLLCFFISSAPVSGQGVNEPTSFQNVQLWIYPEYDDPRLLVMLQGEIVGAQPPAEVRFLVPSTAEMYSAGSMDDLGQYSGGPPQRKSSSVPGWDEISYQLETDTFRVEYYDPIIIGHPEKSITYEFLWLYPISELDVIIQQPRLAENFVVVPSGTAFIDSGGFTSFFYTYSGLDDEMSIQFEIAYTKSDTRPSLSIEDTESDGVSSSLVAVIVLISLAAVIIAVLLWRRTSKPSNRITRRRQTRKTTRKKQGEGKPKSRYCTECGQSVEDSFKFCPNCGMKV